MQPDRSSPSGEVSLAELAELALLSIPADVAITRLERLLDGVSGAPWSEAGILMPLSCLYGYAGRFAEARQAVTRSQAMFADQGARLNWALAAAHASGLIELIAGEPAAAERELRRGYEALLAMSEQGYLASVEGLLAETLRPRRWSRARHGRPCWARCWWPRRKCHGWPARPTRPPAA